MVHHRKESKKSTLMHQILKDFQNGNDIKAIEIWQETSYEPLPTDDLYKLYILTLKLKDIKLLDYHSQEKMRK